MESKKDRMAKFSEIQQQFCAALERDDRKAMERLERQFDALARLAQKDALTGLED